MNYPLFFRTRQILPAPLLSNSSIIQQNISSLSAVFGLFTEVFVPLAFLFLCFHSFRLFFRWLLRYRRCNRHRWLSRFFCLFGCLNHILLRCTCSNGIGTLFKEANQQLFAAGIFSGLHCTGKLWIAVRAGKVIVNCYGILFCIIQILPIFFCTESTRAPAGCAGSKRTVIPPTCR